MKIENIGNSLIQIFSKRKEIIAIYLYGSFLHSEDYKDIDIGLLIQERFIPDNLYEVKISSQLEKLFKQKFKILKPIDVRILNGRPLRFLFSVLKKSQLIYCSNEFERVQFEAKVMKEYIDIKPHHEMYDEMRRLRYAAR